MTNALSGMVKEAEIERLMADTLMERLTAADAPTKATAKSGLRSRNLKAAGSKRLEPL